MIWYIIINPRVKNTVPLVHLHRNRALNLVVLQKMRKDRALRSQLHGSFVKGIPERITENAEHRGSWSRTRHCSCHSSYGSPGLLQILEF